MNRVTTNDLCVCSSTLAPAVTDRFTLPIGKLCWKWDVGSARTVWSGDENITGAQPGVLAVANRAREMTCNAAEAPCADRLSPGQFAKEWLSYGGAILSCPAAFYHYGAKPASNRTFQRGCGIVASRVFAARPLNCSVTAARATSVEEMLAAQTSVDQGSPCQSAANSGPRTLR